MKRNCVCGSHCGIVSSAAKFRTALADMWCGKHVLGIVSQFSLQPYCFIIKSVDFCMYPVTFFRGFLNLLWETHYVGQFRCLAKWVYNKPCFI